MTEVPHFPKQSITSCTAELGISKGASADADSIRRRYNLIFSQFAEKVEAGMSPLEASYGSPPLIPQSVSSNGADNKPRQSEVKQMIECVAARGNISPQGRTYLKTMYGRAVKEAEVKAHPVRSFFNGDMREANRERR